MLGRLSLFAVLVSVAVSASPAERPAVLGKDGVLRWQDTRQEVALFGVNYYVPFAMDYELLKRRQLDHRQAIRDDLEHFRRLGLDVIRLHCWDREISDRQGNLLDNEYLALLDYLLAEARKRGIYAVLTPIAWWGTPNACDGFSNHYDMPQMTTEEAPRKAQQRFLGQFVTHRNRFTGKTYSEDPAVIAFEVINEPLYPPKTTDAQVTEYINALVDAIREAGCTKPVAYNCWGGRHKAAATARCDALTFGWYPTGLVGGRTILDDCLSRVDKHHAMHDPLLDGKLKMVYEFDAADVQGSYMYPAIARAFRSGGAQIAAQFQYDVMALAAENKNWMTHYLNLVYTPGKALSFAIAAETFRSLPRGESYGTYPGNARFGACRVSFQEDLSEFVTETTFLHSNTTKTMPPSPGKLTRIAGCGSSPIVESAGGGAYFLDRISADSWLLQAYPAAVVVDDPYRGHGTEKVRVLFDPIQFRLRLPGWDGAFQVSSGQRKPQTTAKEGTFTVPPGEYFLVRGKAAPLRPATVPAFVVPKPVGRPPAAMIEAPVVWREAMDLPIRVTVAGKQVRDGQVRFRTAGATVPVSLGMERVSPHEFTATVPAKHLRPGQARIEVKITSQYQGNPLTQRFPGGFTRDLRLGAASAGPVPVGLPSAQKSLELRAADDVGKPVKAALRKVDGQAVVALESGGFGPEPSCVSVHVHDLVVPKGMGLVDEVWVEVRGAPATKRVEVAFCLADGRTYGEDIVVTPNWGAAILPVRNLRGLWGTKGKAELAGLKSIRLTYGAWLLGSGEANHAVELRTVTLVPGGEGFPVDVRPATEAPSLVEPGMSPPKVRGKRTRALVVGGRQPGRRALRILADGFDEAPGCAVARMSVPNAAQRFFAGKRPQTVVVTARAVATATDRFELALVEADGAPWGTTVRLTPEWQAIRIPLADLAFFSHWSHPDNRGGEEDRPDGARIRSVNLCFGAWQYPETRSERHGFDIQSVALE
jgi:hypothetical protein